MSDYKDTSSWWWVLHISSLSWLPIAVVSVFYYLKLETVGFWVGIFGMIPIWIICFSRIGHHTMIKNDLRIKNRLKTDIERMKKEYPELQFDKVNNKTPNSSLEKP